MRQYGRYIGEEKEIKDNHSSLKDKSILSSNKPSKKRQLLLLDNYPALNLYLDIFSAIFQY